MSKFKVGEIVVYISGPGSKAKGPNAAENFRAHLGMECEIMTPVFVWVDGDLVHRVRFSDGYSPYIQPKYLHKRPDDNLFTQWFESHIITDIRPTERQVREGSKC